MIIEIRKTHPVDSSLFCSKVMSDTKIQNQFILILLKLKKNFLEAYRF